jgi:hypothetical protein
MAAESREILQLKSTVAQQQKRFANQEAQIQALACGLQTISAQLETNEARPRIVADR